jgi:hypothetical protein
MKNPWIEVVLVYADGHKGPAKAGDVGEGWCDCIAPFGDGEVRLWVRSNGMVQLPMNPVRLEKPFSAYLPIPRPEPAPAPVYPSHPVPRVAP